MHVLVKARLMDVTQEATRVQANQPPLLRAVIKGIGGLATSSPRGNPHIVPRLGLRFWTMRMHCAFYMNVWAGALSGTEAVGHGRPVRPGAAHHPATGEWLLLRRHRTRSLD